MSETSELTGQPEYSPPPSVDPTRVPPLDPDATAGLPPGLAQAMAGMPPGVAQAMTILQLLRQVAVASGRFSDSFAESHDLHRTDLNALSVLMDSANSGRPMSAGELAGRLSLSAPATTALLDRLSRVGHVQRHRNLNDRRIVDIQVSPGAMQLGRQLFEPLSRHVGRALSKYPVGELDLMARVLRDVLAAIQDAQAEAAGETPGNSSGPSAPHQN